MTNKRLGNILDRLIERFGGFELLQLFLLGVTLGCAALGLSNVIARLSAGFMLLLAVISVWTAWSLTRTRLSNLGFGLLGSLIGVFGLTLTVGGIGRPMLFLLFSFFNIPLQLIQNHPLDLSAISAGWETLGASLATLTARFVNWSRGVNSQTLVIDPTVISMVWGLALWLAGFWSMWWVRRRSSALPGLLPVIALLGFNVFYTKSSAGIFWLAMTAGCALVIQASVNFGKARQRWAAHHLAQVEIEPELIFSVLVLSGGMLIAGMTLPSFSIQKIANAIEKALQQPADQDLAKSLGLEQTPIPNQPNTTTGIMPTENHAIGPGPELDKDIVMFISVDGYHPPPFNEYSAVISQSTDRFYWRAQTYSEYNGHNWLANTSRIDLIPANQPFLPGLDTSNLPANDELVIQHVTRIQDSGGYVFRQGEILSLDQSSDAVKNDAGEIISVLTIVDSYTASSRISSPSVEELRASGVEYPRSMLPYLEVPDDLPPRVLDLALDLTADLSTPYDQAVMLEAYLRQFPYSLEVPAPPPDQDAVDYFLFDLKTGYCDYYASAMVMMARAAGIPARLVMGYSEGVYDQQNGYFIVRSSNAHSWAELYFPNIGWVEFEPTSSQPLPFRPGQTANDLQFFNLPPPGQEVKLTIDLERTWMGRAILRLLAIAFLVIFILFLPLETWWLSSLPAHQVLTNIFRRLYRYERLLGIPLDPSRTLTEFDIAFSDAINKSANEKKNSAIAALQADLSYLTGLYNLQLFSEHRLLEEEKQKVIQVWMHFRRNLNQIRRYQKLKTYFGR